MANITQHLTSISLDSRSGAPPGRQLLALTLVAMLVLGSVFPGFALAGEVDSEGEGTVAPVEVPVAPDFDPGGEEEGLEEAPAAGGEEEGGAVEAEAEAEVDLEAPPVDEVSSAATGAPSEPAASAPSASPELAPPAPETAPAEQPASEPAASEPVANQSIVAPKQKDEQAAASGASSGEAAPASEPAPEEEGPSAPPAQPAATPPPDHGRHLAGKNSYVVQSGDCLWHIAAGLLPGDANDAQIAAEVARLWSLNESAIGTGDPSLIYAGTALRLH
jgi:nucleoid-associated protein YgaU